MSEEQDVAPMEEATNEAVTDQVAQEGEADAEAPEAVESDGEEKPKSRHQRRKEQAERLRQERDTAEARAREAEARLKEMQEQAQKTRPPQQDQFSTYEEYQAALSGHYAMQQLDAREQARHQKELQVSQEQVQQFEAQRRAEMAQDWQARAADAKARYADFEQVAFTAPISDSVAEVVMGMEGGTDVAYHLGRNPAEARRISQLPPMEAAIELGRIEARVTGPRPRNITQAPDPVSPVRPKAAAAKNPAKMTNEEYRAARAAGKI